MASMTRGTLSAMRLRALACVLAGAALSCGDALVDERYSGTALFTVDGQVQGSSEYVDVEHPQVNLALFWYVRNPQGGEPLKVEQPGTSFRAEYYRPFKLKLFDEPGAEHLLLAPSGTRYGVGVVGAYQDTNGNKRRDESEPLIGGAAGRAVIRAPTALSAKDSPTGAPLPAGWHLVSTPLNCPQPSRPSSDPVADGECGVPLGSSCRSNADCAPGVCIHDFLGLWPAGTCAIPEPPLNGCRQKGSVLARHPEKPTPAYWLKACTVTADCGRVMPYQCDQQLRACKPTANMPVDMNDRGLPGNYCAPQASMPPPP